MQRNRAVLYYIVGDEVWLDSIALLSIYSKTMQVFQDLLSSNLGDPVDYREVIAHYLKEKQSAGCERHVGFDISAAALSHLHEELCLHLIEIPTPMPEQRNIECGHADPSD